MESVNYNDCLSQPFYEVYNEDTLRRCISYLIEKEKFFRNNVEISQGINPSTYLCYLENSIKNSQTGMNSVDIIYSSGGGDKFGLYRKYATVDNCNACGACHFMREIRAALYKDNYIDIDIINAYPNFMYSITNGKYLGEYINNRDTYLKEIMDSCKVSRDLAKRLFLMIGFGGNYRTWYNNNAKNVQPTEFVINYYNEMQKSRQIIIDHANKISIKTNCSIKNNKFQTPDGKQHSCKLKNILIADSKSTGKITQYELENSCISRYMQFLEVNIIRNVYKKLCDLGIDISTCIYCFDGCMIRKDQLEKIKLTPNQLTDAINDYIHSIDFYIPLDNIKFISKDFEQNDFDPMNYQPCKYNTYSEYLATNPEYFEYPNEPFSFGKLKSLKQGDRIDRQINYIRQYVVIDIMTNTVMCRYNVNAMTMYKPSDFKAILAQNGCEYLYNYIETAYRKDDIDNPRKWLIKTPNGDLYYSLFMGIKPEIINGNYNKEIGEDFERFVNTFAYGESNNVELQLKYIEPLKRLLGSLAMNPGHRTEIAVCIASNQGYGKDTLFDIISSWYDPSETAKSTVDKLVGQFNVNAGKCVVLINECHDRSNDTVNKIKDYITATEVTVNHKYGHIETKDNKSTLFLFSNTTQGIPLDWETGERRGLFYNLQGVPVKKSFAKEFRTKWGNNPDFLSSCYHKACEWFDPSYDFHRNIYTSSKDTMQRCNMPWIVEVIYYNKLFDKYTPSDLVTQIRICLDNDVKDLSVRTITKEMTKIFGNNVFKRSHGVRLIDLHTVRDLIEEKYNILPEDRIDYCEFEED